MQLQSYIINNIPTFEIEDDIKNIIQFFKKSIHSHVAITDHGRFLGMLGENDLDSFEKGNKIETYRYNIESFFVNEETSWLDALEIFARNESNIVPLLNEDEQIRGYYSLTDVVSVFIDTPFFTEPGGILVVSKGVKDYSFSEIAQIVESNNAKLLGGFVTDIKNDIVQVTIKITAENLNEITQTFRRYNYTILYGNADDLFMEDLKQRSNYLDKYLNV